MIRNKNSMFKKVIEYKKQKELKEKKCANESLAE